MNIYHSGTENELSKKNEALYNYFKGFDSNYKKLGDNTSSILEDLIKVF